MPTFWDHVDKSAGADGCWPWSACRLPSGYGQVSLSRGGRKSPQKITAHRQSWTLTHGPIPAGLHVCHRCDNPPCVNPAHLFLGTAKVNHQDRARKGRSNARHGEAHRFARLTETDVRAIWAALLNREATFAELGARYGVSAGTIQQLREGRAWKHVTRDLPNIPAMRRRAA